MPTAYDHLRLECGLQADETARVSATVRFLQARRAGPAGGRAPDRAPRARGGHRVLLRRPSGPRAAAGGPGAGGRPARERVRAQHHRVRDPGAGRGEALQASLLSTHVVVRSPGDRFLSPLDHAGEFESVNTFPVLATRDDDTVLGAAIMLPDHPQLAPAEPRQPVRRHRDRGGAAVARARAVATASARRSPSRTRRCARWWSGPRPPRPSDLFDLHGVMSPSDMTGGDESEDRAATGAGAPARPQRRGAGDRGRRHIFAAATAYACARAPARPV